MSTVYLEFSPYMLVHISNNIVLTTEKSWMPKSDTDGSKNETRSQHLNRHKKSQPQSQGLPHVLPCFRFILWSQM